MKSKVENGEVMKQDLITIIRNYNIGKKYYFTNEDKLIFELSKFITNALNQQRSQIVGEIKKMKKTDNAQEDQSVADSVYYEQQRNIGYNKAIKEFLTKFEKEE